MRLPPSTTAATRSSLLLLLLKVHYYLKHAVTEARCHLNLAAKRLLLIYLGVLYSLITRPSFKGSVKSYEFQDVFKHCIGYNRGELSHRLTILG